MVSGPLKNSFFQMMPKYWDGHTLTAVYDVTGDVLFHDAQAVPQITQEVQKLLGADKSWYSRRKRRSRKRLRRRRPTVTHSLTR